MKRRVTACLALVWMVLPLAGCAQYDFDLVRPESLARRIGSSETIVKLDPVVYRLVAYDNRLVMIIENPTSQRVNLLGDESGVIDPAGESHPLPAETIEPGSSVKLIFPPLPNRTPGPILVFNMSGATQPVEHNPYVYDWNDQGAITVTLVYFYNNTEVQHVFTFERRKV